MKNHRIEVYTPQAGLTHRELYTIDRNEHGDFILELDNGEAIQFTVNGGETAPLPPVESVRAVSQGKPHLSCLKVTKGAFWGDMQMAGAKPRQAEKAQAAELTRLHALASMNKKQAVDQILTAFPGLTTAQIHVGWMDIKATPWAAMMKQSNLKRTALSKTLKRFYEVTGLHRMDRRRGMGKTLQLDENRD